MILGKTFSSFSSFRIVWSVGDLGLVLALSKIQILGATFVKKSTLFDRLCKQNWTSRASLGRRGLLHQVLTVIDLLFETSFRCELQRLTYF